MAYPSSLSKVFEKIVFDQLYDYLITNGLLFESRYGFRKQHSTLLAALELTDRIDIHIVTNELNFILYADDTTPTSPLCSFTHGTRNDVSHVSSRFNS